MRTIKLFGFQFSVGRITTQAKTGTAADIHDASLLERAVRNAIARDLFGDSPRWVAVMETFGIGSTYAWQLCQRFNLNPDEIVRGVHCERCDDAEIEDLTETLADQAEILRETPKHSEALAEIAQAAWRTAINLRKAEGDWEGENG